MTQQPHVPPNARMLQLIMGGWIAQSVCVTAQLGVPQALADGPRPVGELAAELDLDADALRRLLRLLAEIGVVTAGEDGYALGELGRTLVPGTPGSVAAIATLNGSPWQRAAWSALADGIRTGRSPGPEVWAEGGLFSYLAAHPDDAEVFNDAMAQGAAGAAAGVVASYDFGRFGTVVDVGGGHGHLLGGILAAHPGVRGTLLDQPHVVGDARPVLERRGVADRCELVAGDFFESVPAGADAYLMSNIVHDWDDERAGQILAVVAKAMRPDSRLLVVEWVIGDQPHLVGKLFDLQMFVSTDDGRERTRAEFDALLAPAGLKVTGATVGGPGRPTVLEIAPA